MATNASSYRWVVMTTWMIAHVWAFIILESLGFLLPSMREELGLSPVQEGWLGSSSRIGNLVLALPSGWLLSRVNPKALTSATLVAGAIFTFLQGWAPVFALLLVSRFLFGVTVVAREPARPLLVRQWIRPGEVMIVNAAGSAMFGIIGVGLILTPLMLNVFDDNWRYVFYLFGGVASTMALQWLLFGKERASAEYSDALRSQARSPIGSILRYKELWLLGLGLVGIGVNFSAAGTFWPSFMLDKFDVSLTASASIGAVGIAVTAVAGLAVGIVVTRTGKRKLVLWLAGIIMGLGSVGMLWTGNYSYLILLSMARGASWGFFPVIMTLPFELSGIKPREIAVASAFLQTAIWVGAAIGPVLAGVLQESSGDLRMALMVTGLGSLTMTVGALFLPGEWNRRAA